MGKKKKVTEKVKLFYRGPLREPTKVADATDMKTIVAALTDYCSLKKDFKIVSSTLKCRKLLFRMQLGLKSSLRSLKHKRARAVIYDDTASPHLSKYLVEFGYKLGIPVIQAHRLIDFVPTLKLQTLLVLTVEEVTKEEGGDASLCSDAIDKFCLLLFGEPNNLSSEQQHGEKFDLPVLDRVPVTGKSKAKKEARKALKRVKTAG